MTIFNIHGLMEILNNWNIRSNQIILLKLRKILYSKLKLRLELKLNQLWIHTHRFSLPKLFSKHTKNLLLSRHTRSQ